MALSNGAHLRLTVTDVTFDFMLDPTVEKPWRRGYEAFFANTFQTAGTGRENVRRELILPDFSDWSGGQENRYFNSQDPVVYDHGLCNPRIPGELRGEPPTTDGTAITGGSAITKVYFANAGGLLWAFTNKEAATSTNMSAWTARTTGIGGADRKIYGAVSDGNYAYVCWWDSGGSIRQVVRLDTTTQTNMWSADQASGNPWAGIAYCGPYLYVMGQGGAVYRIDVTATIAAPPAAGTAFYQFGVNLSSGNGGIISGDTGVFMFYGQGGRSMVHEITAGVTGQGRAVWNLPEGFTATAGGYAQGYLYIAGTYSTKAVLFRMNNETREKELVDFIGRSAGAAYTPTAVAAGPGAQVLIGMQSGEVFIYDAEKDAISQLGVRTGDGNLDAVTCFLQYRVAGYLKTSDTTIRTRAWDMDDATSTSAANCVMPAWDLNIAEIRKLLVGYSLTFRPVASSTATIKYMLDESGDPASDGAYTALSAIDTSVSAGRAFVAVSSQGAGNSKKFHMIRNKLTTSAGARITSIVPFVKLSERQSVWDAWVIVTDEHLAPRPSTRQDMGQDIAADLNTASTGIIPSEVVATLTNGAEDPKPGVTTTHTVWIEVAEFDVSNPGDSRTGTGFRATAHLRLWDLVP